MKKGPTAGENLYGAGSLGIGNMIYSRYGRILTTTACPTGSPWFGKLITGSKLRTGVINKKYSGITYNVVKALLKIREEEWKGLNKISER